MSFRIRGLSPDTFAPLFHLDDEALAARAIRRVVTETPHSAPCRVSLADAEPGEMLLLLSYEHQGAASPFRASGPIFVRQAAARAFDEPGVVPDAIVRRPISARAYDEAGMMLEGELVAGEAVAQLLATWLARPEVDKVHLHYARRGCFAAVAERS